MQRDLHGWGFRQGQVRHGRVASNSACASAHGQVVISAVTAAANPWWASVEVVGQMPNVAGAADDDDWGQGGPVGFNDLAQEQPRSNHGPETTP